MKEGWIVKKFSEVFDLQMGKTPSRDNVEYWGEENYWVAISDIKGKYISETKECITDKAVVESKIKKVKAGTVIMSFKLTVGRTAIAIVDLYTNEAIMAFNLKSNYEVLPEYTYYYLKAYKWEGGNKAVMGITLNKASISANKFVIPPLPEQSRIVEELDLLSNIIEKKRQQLSELDNLAQSIFYDMFGDPVTNEKGWEIVTLGDICDVTSFKRVLIEEVVDEGIPFIRGTELMALSKGENVEFTLFITDEHYEKVKTISGVPKIGDLLIPSINSEARIWILNTDKPMYYKDGRVLWVHVNEKLYASECLKYIMHELIKSSYTSVASGATFAELKLFVLRELKTIIPPLTLQQLFAQKIEAIEKKKELIKQSIKETEKLFNSRMDYYFN